MNEISPLTSVDCDLRGLEWMPLYGDRLFGSDTWLMAAPEARCAAMMLWWASWKQRPAGSLADQDKALAQLAGYGSALKAWLNIKEEAMRGWIKCTDGRLYHPVVCEFAREAWARRLKERERKAVYRSSKNVPRTSTGTGMGHKKGQDADEYGDGHVEKKRQDSTSKKEPELRSAPPDARQELRTIGGATLQAITGFPGGRIQPLIGKWLKDCGDNCALVLSVIREAAEFKPAGDPVAWISEAVKTREFGQKNTTTSEWSDVFQRRPDPGTIEGDPVR